MSVVCRGLAVMRWRVVQRWLSRANARSPWLRRPRRRLLRNGRVAQGDFTPGPPDHCLSIGPDVDAAPRCVKDQLRFHTDPSFDCSQLTDEVQSAWRRQRPRPPPGVRPVRTPDASAEVQDAAGRYLVAMRRRHVANDLAAVGDFQADRHGLPDSVPPLAGRSWPVSAAETRTVRTQEARHEELKAIAVGQHCGDSDLARLGRGKMQGASRHQGGELRFWPVPRKDFSVLGRPEVWPRFAGQVHNVSFSPHQPWPTERAESIKGCSAASRGDVRKQGPPAAGQRSGRPARS
jgi:hypothetical protein